MINLNLTDDASCLDIAPCTLLAPTVRFDLNLKKTQPTLKPTNSSIAAYYRIFFNIKKIKIKSLSVQQQRKKSLRWLSPLNIRKPFTCRLPDDNSIFTAELRVILLALKHLL